ncbi:hypothetical protein [Streptomyces sp. NBC_00878]|uniref:hypothetical protein n=1 Tax=Streptomyces sp. NBC_00878 TaxID=2975854 RepID=UPI002258107B|nr:hypothetical protein [Streptomyces sp. NBC_00878]MCX4908389.1 hypothetical protein [Streptomyces sp. NBC_00878]
MMDRYPIVCHRELRPRWRRSARLERRHPLIARRDEVLVHNVRGAYTTGTPDPTRRTAVTLVDVRPDRSVFAHWRLTASGARSFHVTVTFRCTVVAPAEIARRRREGAPWDVQYILARDLRPRQLQGEYSEGDEDRMRLALTELFQAQPAHRDIAGVRVRFAQVSVELASLFRLGTTAVEVEIRKCLPDLGR